MHSLTRASAWMVSRIAWSLAAIALGGGTMFGVEAKQMETESRSAAERETAVLTTLSGHTTRDLTVANMARGTPPIVSAVTPSPTPISKRMRTARQIRQTAPSTPHRLRLWKRRYDVA